MISNIKTISLNGLDGELIEVQTDITNGIPTFEIVGLPDASVREAKERIRVAIKNSQIDFPSRKILINLAPADTKKLGTSYDLPIAIGILATLDLINKNDLENTIFIGELALDGKINHINGVLPMCIEALNLGIKRVILPKANEIEGAVVSGLEIIGVENLSQVIDYLNKKINIKKVEMTYQNMLQRVEENSYDFSDIKGQESVKRALEIAVAGGHNCLMIGEPGSGKTMLATRITSILPDLTFEEALEITKINSISGNLNKNMGIVNYRPFRNPHHTISPTSMVGGGKIPMPGEISLAHHGVLFLDELPEFKRESLEVLRGPLEDRNITISRLHSVITYPANFMLVASMNPCPCGYYGSSDKECTCSSKVVRRYLNKVSGPLLDRIDIHIEVKPVKYSKLNAKERIETSNEIKFRVNKARKIQIERYKNEKIFSNSELTSNMLEKYCELDEGSRKLLEIAFEKLKLSARAYSKILKIARTIADLEEKEKIEQKHIAEAIQYRTLDKKYGERI